MGKKYEDFELKSMDFGVSSLINNNNHSRNFINPVNTFVTGEVTVEREGQNSSRFYWIRFDWSSSFEIVREALRQINIQMIGSSNLYDGLENLWLGSADESLTNQQVYSLSSTTVFSCWTSSSLS